MSASVSSSIEVLLSCDGGGSAYRDCFSFLGQFFDHLGVTDWHPNSDSGHLLDHVEVIYQTGAISGYLGFADAILLLFVSTVDTVTYSHMCFRFMV